MHLLDTSRKRATRIERTTNRFMIIRIMVLYKIIYLRLEGFMVLFFLSLQIGIPRITSASNSKCSLFIGHVSWFTCYGIPTSHYYYFFNMTPEGPTTLLSCFTLPDYFIAMKMVPTGIWKWENAHMRTYGQPLLPGLFLVLLMPFSKQHPRNQGSESTEASKSVSLSPSSKREWRESSFLNRLAE